MAKKIIYYLKDIIYLGLIYNSYSKNKNKTKISIISFSFKLIEYENGDYVENFKDRKFIIQYYYFIIGAVIF